MNSSSQHELNSEEMDIDSNLAHYNHISVADGMSVNSKAGVKTVQGSQTMVVKHPQVSYSCDECGKVFTERRNLTRHEKTHIYTTYCFKCKICEKTFTRKEHLKRHLKLHSDVPTSSESITMDNEPGNDSQAEVKGQQGVQAVLDQRSYICDDCKKVFTKKSHLTRHEKTHNRQNLRYKCEVCSKIFSRQEHLKRHFKLHSDVPYRLPQHIRKCKPMQQLNTFSIIKINPTLQAEYDMALYMKELKFQLYGHLLDHIGGINAIKWYGRLSCLMIRGKPETILVRVEKSEHESQKMEKSEDESKDMPKPEDEFVEVENPDENRIIDKFYFNCSTQLLLRDDEVEGQLATAFAEITNRFEEFTELGSGWRLKQIITFELNMSKYIGLIGGASVKSKKVKGSKSYKELV